MLDRMEAAGLTQRVPDKEDRRVIRIRLTEKARALKGRYDAVSSRMNEIYFNGFSDAEIEAFEEYLKRIVKNLEEENANG
jgi:DNA-binding MarR family transcriptional regulator